MTKTGKIVPNTNVLSRIVDDELVLYDTGAGMVHFLNGTARQVWDLCDGSRGRDEIVDRMLEHFDAPRERIERDLDQLLEILEQQGLIRG